MERKDSRRDNRYRTVICSNCNGRGHVFRDCKKPIHSNGMLAWTLIGKTPEDHNRLMADLTFYKEAVPAMDEQRFLQWLRSLWNSGGYHLAVCLIQRRHTISFEAIVRGKYNYDELKIHRDRLTSEERISIRTKPWEELYAEVMTEKDARYMQREKRKAKQLFETIDFDDFLGGAGGAADFHEPSWEFPKGRRFVHETDRQCALREFEEETNIPTADVLMLEASCDEQFCGINKRIYRNKYYVAFVHPKGDGPFLDRNNAGQMAEVADARWFFYEDALAILRPYHPEKRVALQTSYEYVMQALMK